MNDNPISQSVLDDLRALDNGDSNLITELFGVFLVNADKHRDEIASAVSIGDAVQLRAAAHALKGGAASLGADELTVISRTLEEIGRSGTVLGAGALLLALGAAIESIRHWFSSCWMSAAGRE